MDIETELNSQEFKLEWERHQNISNSFLDTLLFCNYDFFRDKVNSERNFFIRVSDDYIQSIIAIQLLSKEGIHNQCRRELRYLVELALKSCSVVQNNSASSYESQMVIYEKLLKDDSISMVKDLQLRLLSTSELQANFRTDVKRLYGDLCIYVHATARQLTQRIDLARQGRYIGFEGLDELRKFNDEFEKVISIVIVLLFHSIPEWVVGDYLVEPDGGTKSFYFNQSKYIIDIDRRFDYKAERQSKIGILESERKERMRF